MFSLITICIFIINSEKPNSFSQRLCEQVFLKWNVDFLHIDAVAAFNLFVISIEDALHFIIKFYISFLQ